MVARVLDAAVVPALKTLISMKSTPRFKGQNIYQKQGPSRIVNTSGGEAQLFASNHTDDVPPLLPLRLRSLISLSLSISSQSALRGFLHPIAEWGLEADLPVLHWFSCVLVWILRRGSLAGGEQEGGRAGGGRARCDWLSSCGMCP